MCSQISKKLGIPIPLLQRLLGELVESGIISQVKGSTNKEVAYQLSRHPEKITIKDVTDAIDRNGVDNIPVIQSNEILVQILRFRA